MDKSEDLSKNMWNIQNIPELLKIVMKQRGLYNWPQVHTHIQMVNCHLASKT